MVLNLKIHHTVDILVISKTLKVYWFMLWFRTGTLHLCKNLISLVSCSGSFSVELAQGSFVEIRDVILKKPANTLPFISYSKTIEN